MPRLLIAHQGTIPHYRIRFYELLESMRPPWWSFDVVYDAASSEYREALPEKQFAFPILPVRTSSFRLLGRSVSWQHFFARAARYDVLITDTHVSNLTYPLLTAYRLAGQKQILWGHPRNMNVSSLSSGQRVAQKGKQLWIRSADAFFAYTESGRSEVIAMGTAPERIHVLGNTIDIQTERSSFERLVPQREDIRRRLGVDGRKVLAAVGRLRADKRIPFLLQCFKALHARDRDWHLFVVGEGPDRDHVQHMREQLGADAITYFGALVGEADLGPVLTAADAYVLAGAVGLGPLQAFCYDLPAITFQVDTHGPEFEYLNSANSLVLSADASPDDFAVTVERLWPEICARRPNVFRSIAHLTLENMAARFIAGVDSVLKGAHHRSDDTL